MKYVDSGSGKIPLITLIAILSISLTVNLPGLAISPLLGKLKEVFPNVTELETQLLVTLPNLIIIPFILWSGKLCNQGNQLMVLVVGLAIYAFSGILFLFADKMVQLILLSCLLGIGCGLVIPLAASLIAQNFSGDARTKQLGMKSGVSNFMVIIATLFVGWIAKLGWHLSFLVYLVPIIPMCLVPFMSRKYIDKYKIIDPNGYPEPLKAGTNKEIHPSDTAKIEAEQVAEAEGPAPTSSISKTVDTVSKAPASAPRFSFTGKSCIVVLLGVIGVYIAMTYCTMVVSDYLPFTMEHYKMDTGQVGVATALYFLAATLAGFTLTWAIKKFGRKTPYLAIGVCIIGLYAMGFVHTYGIYLATVFLTGYGYGIMQPIIYDKTAFIAPTAQQATEYFGYTLTGNYIAIAMVPFVVDLFARIFGASTINFPYILNASILIGVLIWGFYKCRSYIFYVTANQH